MQDTQTVSIDADELAQLREDLAVASHDSAVLGGEVFQLKRRVAELERTRHQLKLSIATLYKQSGAFLERVVELESTWTPPTPKTEPKNGADEQ